MVDSEVLSARLDPEEMLGLVASFHERVADVASRFDGFVAQWSGDGALIYFGYPSAREHDAEQAVCAGLAIRDAAGALKAPPGLPLRARVGIATGLVVVGERPAGGGVDGHVAIGETPGLAIRLQAAAEPGEVVIAASTRQLVGRRFDCRPLGVDEATGLPQAVEGWRVRGETAGVSRFEARRVSSLAPLVGRREEMERLLRRWDQAKTGEGRIVLLSGEPGIGKSRIAEDLLVGLAGEPHACVRYFCSPNHANTPLYPFMVQLERAAGFEPDSDASAKLDRLEALVRPRSKNVSRDAALLAELLGVPLDGRYPALAMSSQQKREMTLATLLDQLDGVAAQGPLLIVFEDAHWIDPTSLDLLDRMVARIADLPVLLVVTVRPEFEPAWVGQPHVTTLALSRLGRRDSASIIGGVANEKALPDAAVEQIVSHAEGVPLFIEELTRSLLESGLLRETPDRYLLDGPLLSLAIPSTLQGSLVARLDRLGPGKDVAVTGAAIGREFSRELVAAVSALSPMDLDTALERLTASGLVFRRGMPPDDTYTFKHALIQDAAYATLLRSRRRELHGTIAEMLVKRFPATAESVPELVAHHYTEAGLAKEAIGYWRKAGQLANARSAGREAVSSYERALSLLDALPESASTLEQGFEIRSELRAPLMMLGEGRKILDRLREAEVLAERLNDDRRRGNVCNFITTAHALLGEIDEALVTGTRALEIARGLGDVRLGVLATSSLQQVHYFRGEYSRVVELAIDNLAALPLSEWVHGYFTDAAPPPIHDRFWLLLSLGQLGRFADAAEHESEAIRLALSIDNPYAVALTHQAAGAHYLSKGDWIRARSLIERGVAVARAEKLAAVLTLVVTHSAWILAQLGETSEALNRLREGERLLEGQAARGFGVLAGTYYTLGRASLLLGRLDEAQRLGDRAVESSPRQPGYAAHAMHLLGDIATHPDRFDAQSGEIHYRQALALAERLGMRPLVAHCHLGLGRLHQHTGRRERALECLATATAMYRSMGMTYWLEQAESERRRWQELD